MRTRGQWAASAAALAAVMGALGGCATVQNARARIVREPPRCADETVQVYFEPQSAEVTREGRMVIAQAASSARGCQVKAVEVTGLADAAGAPEASLELSKRRADAVAAVLAQAGLPAAQFQLAAAGQAGAVGPDGHVAPLRRRADITLRLAPGAH